MTTVVDRPDPADFTGRHLRFHPVDAERVTTLTPDEARRYNRDGYLAPIDVFDASEVASMRAYIEELLAEATDSYAVTNLHPQRGGLWDLVTEPRILALVRDVLGPEAVCWGTHLFAKLPHDGKVVPFHQDAIYWPFDPARTVTVWLAIDDVDAANAAMQFVPGSHLDGPIPHEELALDGTRVLERRAIGMEHRPGRAVDELRAGQVSLHADLLLHGSDANTSGRRRAGLTLRYAAADVRLLPGFDAWKQHAVHVLDGDPSGFWPHHPRPGRQ